MSKIIKSIGDWNITRWGLEHIGHPPYEIHRARLWEADWIEHMKEKNWIKIVTFETALYEAQNIHGGKKHDRL